LATKIYLDKLQEKNIKFKKKYFLEIKAPLELGKDHNMVD